MQTLYAPCTDTTTAIRTKSTTTTTTTPQNSPTPNNNPSTPTPTPSPSVSLGQPTTITQIVVVTAPNGQVTTSASLITQTPTLSAGADTKPKSAANVGLIVGSVIAGFFGLILLGGLIWFFLKRRQTNWDDIFDKDEGYEEQSPRRRSMNLLENEPKPYQVSKRHRQKNAAALTGLLTVAYSGSTELLVPMRPPGPRTPLDSGPCMAEHRLWHRCSCRGQRQNQELRNTYRMGRHPPGRLCVIRPINRPTTRFPLSAIHLRSRLPSYKPTSALLLTNAHLRYRLLLVTPRNRLAFPTRLQLLPQAQQAKVRATVVQYPLVRSSLHHVLRSPAKPAARITVIKRRRCQQVPPLDLLSPCNGKADPNRTPLPRLRHRHPLLRLRDRLG